MEETDGDHPASEPDLPTPTLVPVTAPRRMPAIRLALILPALLGLALASCGAPTPGNALAKVKSEGLLRYGSDKEGGGPYVYPDPDKPRDVVGFEVEIEPPEV